MLVILKMYIYGWCSCGYVIEIFKEDGVYFVNIVENKEYIIDNLRVKNWGF